MKNKKNVLDFLSDDKNENLKTPIKYNKNNKRYYYYYCNGFLYV